jgi:hypothetical protein
MGKATRLLSLGVAVSCIVLAIGGLRQEMRDAELVGLAKAVEAGAVLTASQATAYSTLPAIDAFACGPASRMAISAHLAIVDASLEHEKAVRLARARQALERALRCSPLDGNLWLRHAMVVALSEGPNARVLRSLEISTWTAPYEAWIVLPRIEFVLHLVEEGYDEFAPIVGRDLVSVLIHASRPDITSLLSGSNRSARSAANIAIHSLPAERRKMVEEILNASEKGAANRQ